MPEENQAVNEAAEHLLTTIGGECPPALVQELARLDALKNECDARISALIQGFALGQGLDLSANINVDTRTGKYVVLIAETV